MSTPFEDKRRTNSLDVRRANIYKRISEVWDQLGDEFKAPELYKLTDEQIDLFINGRGEEGDDNYVEPTGDGFGLTDADLFKLVRRVEAAHSINNQTNKDQS